jgi:phospholipase/carboxylesterase
MNRIQSLEAFASPTGPVAAPAQQPICAAECHFFLAPLHYEPNYSYPLVVWLHGADNNENQLKQILPLISLRNYVGAATRGTAFSPNDDGSGIRFCWQHDETSVALAEERLWQCIDGARRRYNISVERVFLAGLECGGTMAMRLALRNPDQFAGALSFGGVFPAGPASLSRLGAARRLPLFFATTRESVRYPEEQLCQHLRLFHTAGLPVTVRCYPGEDGLTTTMLSDMDRWIMEHISQQNLSSDNDVVEHRFVK